MKNEILLKRLYGIKDGMNVLGMLDALIADVKLEMAVEAAPRYNGSIYKAAAKFAKYCQKEMGGIRPGIAGAFRFVGEDGNCHQAICDGYVGVAYSKPIDGLVEIPDGINDIDMAKILPKDVYAETDTPDYATLKRTLRMEKANRESDKKWKDRFIVRLGNGACVDATYLIRIMELAGMTNGETTINTYGNTVYSMVGFKNVIDGNEINAFCMPVRITGNARYLIDMLEAV